jgi:hypothetical protein
VTTRIRLPQARNPNGELPGGSRHVDSSSTRNVRGAARYPLTLNSGSTSGRELAGDRLGHPDLAGEASEKIDVFHQDQPRSTDGN